MLARATNPATHVAVQFRSRFFFTLRHRIDLYPSTRMTPVAQLSFTRQLSTAFVASVYDVGFIKFQFHVYSFRNQLLLVKADKPVAGQRHFLNI